MVPPGRPAFADLPTRNINKTAGGRQTGRRTKSFGAGFIFPIFISEPSLIEGETGFRVHNQRMKRVAAAKTLASFDNSAHKGLFRTEKTRFIARFCTRANHTPHLPAKAGRQEGATPGAESGVGPADREPRA